MLTPLADPSLPLDDDVCQAAVAEEKKKAEEALASGYSDPTMGGGYADPNGMVVYGAGMGGMGGGMGMQGGGYGYGY